MSEQIPNNAESFFAKRRKQLLALAAVIIIAAGGGVSYEFLKSNNSSISHNQTHSINDKQINNFLFQAGQSLINHHEDSLGGWRFKSGIQYPHYQTDRDVGAASVGMGFLALSEADPNNQQWVTAAKNTATWLAAVSKQDGHGGRYWPDYSDNQDVSESAYTSFDDGAIGIGDFFWQLYEKTNDPQYKQIAIESVQWTLSQAEPYNKNGLSGYRWKWDTTDPKSPYYMGMGEGAAGITYALATFSQRLQPTDPALAARCTAYVKGSLNYIESVRLTLAENTNISRTIPETGVAGQDGDTTLNSGYLSGAAGDAYMYMSLYRIYGDKKYLDAAIEILNWLSDSKNGPLVKQDDGSVTWRLSLDPQGGNVNHSATGVEEGNAGIGWTYLQAYELTKNKAYLREAQSAANWLLKVAIKNSDGSLSWHEDENPVNPIIHANLNNGAAGVGMFLQDIFIVTGKPSYHDAADRSILGLKNSAKSNNQGLYWNDNGGDAPYSNDPSWHWGTAGIIEFAQRLNGGPQDILGEQPGFPSPKN